MVYKKLQKFLEKIDHWRDRLLFPLIKKYWPRFIAPNHLSSLRIGIGIFLGILLYYGYRNKVLIVLLFVFALLLDLFDGSVARALNKKTQIGAFIDPLGDKILIIPIAIYGLLKYHKWLLLFVLLPEIINVILAIYFQTREIFHESNIFGKTKMVLQSFAFGIILITWPNRPSDFSVAILLISVIFGILSFSLKWADSAQKIKNAKNL